MEHYLAERPFVSRAPSLKESHSHIARGCVLTTSILYLHHNKPKIAPPLSEFHGLDVAR